MSDVDGLARRTLDLSPAEQAAVEANGGWLNVHAYVLNAAGDPTSSVSFSHYLGSNAQAAISQAQREVATVHVAPDRSSRTRQRFGSARSPLMTAQDIGECWVTYWELVATTYKDTIVGEMHVVSDTPVFKFTYGHTADSDIDVGYKNNFGNWGISGSAHVGNSLGSAASVTQSGPFYRAFETEFGYEHYQLFSDCYSGNHIYRGTDEVDPGEWTGGYTQGCCSISFYDNNRKLCCDNHFGAGGGFDRNTNDFKKLSGAVTAFGVTLGAQSGSSTFVSIHYEFGQNANHYLYGLTQIPSNAGIVYASNT